MHPGIVALIVILTSLCFLFFCISVICYFRKRKHRATKINDIKNPKNASIFSSTIIFNYINLFNLLFIHKF